MWAELAAVAVVFLALTFAYLLDPHRGWVRYERAAGWLDYTPGERATEDRVRVALRVMADEEPPPEVVERILNRIREEGNG